MAADDENVRVAVRCRPLGQSELKKDCRSIVEVDELNSQISVNAFTNKRSGATEPSKLFTFDSTFGPSSKQLDVYNKAARRIIENVLEGYNGTIFAYGQTGTGKTFTMTGDHSVPELFGIIPNSFAHIFDFISHCGMEKQFLVRVSFLEIYNEEVHDLLGKDKTQKYELKERSDIVFNFRFLVRVSFLEIYNEEVRDLLGKDQTQKYELKERSDIVFNFRFLVRVSFLEIYNEEVRDLLGKDQTQKYELKERSDIVFNFRFLVRVSFLEIYNEEVRDLLGKDQTQKYELKERSDIVFNFRFLVRVSFLEIYNEEVRDLLGKDQTQKYELKERSDIGVYVKDLSSFTVGSADEMEKIMTVGNKNRATATTNMNEHSSRSHAIFTITIECSELGPDKTRHVRVGKLNLVDLAGSERQSKTGSVGQRLLEAAKINLSLSTLGNVISSLVDPKSTHIPYRNSKLTRLLQDSLGGNSKTVMIANVGPADYNYDETVSTLRYANRAKNIRNKARINEDPKDAMLRKFQAEIEELRKQLAEGGGSDGSGGEEASDEEGRKLKKEKASDEHLKSLEAEVAAFKLQLQQEMSEENRSEIEHSLSTKEAALAKAREDHNALIKKLEMLERKVIVGGENLLEKAETQAALIEQSRKELEERAAREVELRRALEIKQAERVDMEEKYNSLQEEAAGKSKKLKKVWSMLNDAKAEYEDVRAEQQRETESLLDNVRELTKELKLQQLIIDSYVPGHYLELIEQNCVWADEIGDWQLKCVAYTGNNMRKTDYPPHEDSKEKVGIGSSSVWPTLATTCGRPTILPTRTARRR